VLNLGKRITLNIQYTFASQMDTAITKTNVVLIPSMGNASSVLSLIQHCTQTTAP
jgi:hypothetical protein